MIYSIRAAAAAKNTDKLNLFKAATLGVSVGGALMAEVGAPAGEVGGDGGDEVGDPAGGAEVGGVTVGEVGA